MTRLLQLVTALVLLTVAQCGKYVLINIYPLSVHQSGYVWNTTGLMYRYNLNFKPPLSPQYSCGVEERTAVHYIVQRYALLEHQMC